MALYFLFQGCSEPVLNLEPFFSVLTDKEFSTRKSGFRVALGHCWATKCELLMSGTGGGVTVTKQSQQHAVDHLLKSKKKQNKTAECRM